MNFLSTDIKALFNPNVQLKAKTNNLNILDTKSIRDISNNIQDQINEDNSNHGNDRQADSASNN